MRIKERLEKGEKFCYLKCSLSSLVEGENKPKGKKKNEVFVYVGKKMGKKIIWLSLSYSELVHCLQKLEHVCVNLNVPKLVACAPLIRYDLGDVWYWISAP